MKTKIQKFGDKPATTERKMNHKFSLPRPGTIEVQTWGLDAGQGLLCAGVHHVRDLSARTLHKLATSWRRWRKWYDTRPENVREDYPAKHGKPLAFYGAHPIDDVKSTKWIPVAA